jgi:hypothetical protein
MSDAEHASGWCAYWGQTLFNVAYLLVVFVVLSHASHGRAKVAAAVEGVPGQAMCAPREVNWLCRFIRIK